MNLEMSEAIGKELRRIEQEKFDAWYAENHPSFGVGPIRTFMEQGWMARAACEIEMRLTTVPVNGV